MKYQLNVAYSQRNFAKHRVGVTITETPIIKAELVLQNKKQN